MYRLICLVLLLGLLPQTVIAQGPLTSTVYLPSLMKQKVTCVFELAAPKLIAPADNQMIAVGQPMLFQWQPAEEACPVTERHYALQIATASSFSYETLVHTVGYQPDEGNTTRYTETSYYLANNEIGVYYWRVMTFEGDQASPWSAVYRLTVTNNGPVDLTLMTHEQGFDTCAAPQAADLAMWRAHSPYRYLGIYLGGVNHYPVCKRYNEQYQTAAWLREVAQQGWQFIPIWVGRQAPCSGYVNTFSLDLLTAYQQGMAEARLAVAAAMKLGLISLAQDSTIIYYDLEYYEPSGSCHDAAKAFLVGWITELQANGHKAGIYSIARAVDDWYELPVTPDSTWAAWYMRQSYDPAVTVQTVNERWIAERNWAKERLFQYTGSHDEQWGGVTLNIDSNAAAGWVATTREAESKAVGFASSVQSLRLWTPPPIQAVFFLNEQHGWQATWAAGELTLQWTQDAGQQWARLALDYDVLFPVAEIYLGGLNEQELWLVLKEMTNVNASRGVLLKTSDGGKTWQTWPLPLGEPIEFINAQVGWLRGGPLGTERYLTLDGGRSWLARP